MNSVKIAYLAIQTICELAFLALAVLSPIYLTPGFYYWTVIGLILMIATGIGSTQRINSWDNF